MNNFVPDMYFENIYVIDYKKLKSIGIKCLLFDLDNTISSYESTEPDKKLKELFYTLQKDFKLVIISNNKKERVRPFKEKLNVDSSYSSMKPLKKKYLKIMDIYNFKDTQIASVGDQLITDIYGANRVGITSILVNPISPNEPLRTRINRSIERKIIRKLNKSGIDVKGSEV
jgi:uncharacterized protein